MIEPLDGERIRLVMWLIGTKRTVNGVVYATKKEARIARASQRRAK